MKFKEFVDQIEKEIKSFLPKEYEEAKVDVQVHTKLNDQYLGLTVMKPGKVMASPTINMEHTYDDFISDPEMTIKDVMRGISRVIQEATLDVDLNQLSHYEKAKERLFVRVTSAERNTEVLGNVPHQLKDDLALTYHILIEAKGDEMGSTMVTNDMLNVYGISAEQLHADAMENSSKLMPVHVAVMGTVIEQLMRIASAEVLRDAQPDSIVDIIAEGVRANDPMIVVTNNHTVNGASAIFYPNVLDQISEGFQGDFFILPSSVHETLVIPDNGTFEYAGLREMVQQINESEVSPEDRLADDVYHYDAKDRVFERADRFASRMKEKATQIEHGEKLGKEQKVMQPKIKKHDMEL